MRPSVQFLLCHRSVLRSIGTIDCMAICSYRPLERSSSSVIPTRRWSIGSRFGLCSKASRRISTKYCSSPTKPAVRSSPRRRFSGFSLVDGHDNTSLGPSSSLTTGDSTSANRGNLVILSHLSGLWWGAKRLDFALYCPEGLTSFPTVTLPNVLHASFWESSDLAAFIVRQFITGEL